MASKAKKTARTKSVSAKAKKSAAPKASETHQTSTLKTGQKSGQKIGQKTVVARAKKVVSDNANGKTALMALFGAGALALVSTESGRGMLKSAASYLTTLAEDAYASASGSGENKADAQV